MKSNRAVAVAAILAVAAAGHGSNALARPPGKAALVRGNRAVGSEDLWHLRAGLNVAALSCRGPGRESVAPDYARLLGRHKGLLASAYAQEQRNQGGGMDRHLTRLYNRFAMQNAPDRFCAKAADVASDAAAMDSPTLARSAGALLDRLE